MLTSKFSSLTMALVLGLSTTSMTLAAGVKEETTMIPKNCQYLKEVTTGQTHLRKRIESILIGNNFNADFAVPAGVKFTSYKATMIPENDAKYDVAINLKYSDMSVSTVIQKTVLMKRGETYSLPFQSATARQPFQVNFNISGANNNAYTISIMACQ